MSGSTQRGSVTQRGTFNQSCAYCGARFEVFVSSQPAIDEDEDYACPECGKRYTVPAALPPLVRLLSPRTDGRTGMYQETMF